MKITILKSFALLLAFSSLALSLEAQCDVLSINSVLLDPRGGAINFDTDGNGSALDADEFLEVCNLSMAPVDLSTVSVVDAGSNIFVLSGTLAPGSCVFVVSNWDQTVNAVPSNVIDLGVSDYIGNGGDLLQLVQSSSVLCEVAVGGFPCLSSSPNCVDFPDATDGCVNNLTPGAVNCGGTLVTVPCPDLMSFTPGSLNVGVTESSCTVIGGTPSGGLIVVPTLSCPTGSSLLYSLDGFATEGTTMLPSYDQSNAITISARCTCDGDPTTISETSVVTTMPGVCPCPNLTPVTEADITLNITESTCDAGNNTVSGGVVFSFIPDPCPAGSALNYSVDGSAFSTTVPTYNQTTAITIVTQCICEGDPAVVSIQASMTTVPGVCMTPPCPTGLAMTTAPAAIISSESTCEADNMTLSGGVVAVPATACPTETTLEYSTDGGMTWSTVLPTYNQTTAVTIMTRCNCDLDSTISSGIGSVTTVPGICPVIICDAPIACLLYTSPSPRDGLLSRMPSSA